MAEFVVVLAGSGTVEMSPAEPRRPLLAAARLSPVAALHHQRNRSALNDSTLQRLDEITLAAAQSAKDRRSWMLEIIKANIEAAPHQANRHDANGDASAGIASGATGRIADEPRENGNDSGEAKLERQPPAPLKAVADCRAAAFELLNANVNAALEFARLSANARPPAEFIALSTSYARTHFELVVAHMAALGAASQALTST